MAAFAVRVRFFQREGYSPATALSSGAIASTASWVAKGVLLLISLAFTAGSFEAPESSGGHHTAIWIVVGVVLAAGVAVALISVIPRLPRLASARIRPQLAQIWADVKAIAVEPRKIAYVVTGSVLSQLFVALALGAALHAVGQQASLATLLVVITGAAIIGGAVPVPGGAGVIEAGLIAGLTTAGIPQDQAVAAVFIQRLCTAYLPPSGDGSRSPGCAAASTCDGRRGRQAAAGGRTARRPSRVSQGAPARQAEAHGTAIPPSRGRTGMHRLTKILLPCAATLIRGPWPGAGRAAAARSAAFADPVRPDPERPAGPASSSRRRRRYLARGASAPSATRAAAPATTSRPSAARGRGQQFRFRRNWGGSSLPSSVAGAVVTWIALARRPRASAAFGGQESSEIEAYARGAALYDAMSVAETPGAFAAGRTARWYDIQVRADSLAETLYALRERRLMMPSACGRRNCSPPAAVRSAMDAERAPPGRPGQAEVVRNRLADFETALRAFRAAGQPTP